MKPYYSEAGIEIYHGDCREILPSLPPIDLVLTDPPYEEEAHIITRRTRALLEDRAVYQNIPFGQMTDDLRAALCGIPCNWLLMFCQAEAVKTYKDLLGEKYRRPMVWIKPDSSPQFTGDRPAMGYESIVCAWCSGGRSKWNGGGRRGVFTYLISDGNTRQHSTQKPLGLIKELMTLFSLGGIVLDPCMGSGTTLRAAKDMGLDAIGIDTDEGNCEIAANRLRQEVKNCGRHFQSGLQGWVWELDVERVPGLFFSFHSSELAEG